MKNRISAWIVLGVITIVAGLGLAFVNEMTKNPIEEQALINEEKAKLKVMPGAVQFEKIELEDGNLLFVAKDESGETLGYVGKSVSKGYGGPVEVITGVKADGTVTGINVGGMSFSETPGLGAKALEDDFTSQFAGKMSPVRLGDPAKNNEIDAITAATRTSNAVLAAVNAVAKEVNLYLNPDAGADAVAEGTPYTGEANGFAGPVVVVVTVKDDGTISGLKVVEDERFAETDGYGAQALEPDFGKQFIGKTFPLTLESVDGISGATMTTKAVIEAANKAYEDKNVVLPEGITYQGEADGFAGPVAVLVTVKEDKTITALKIGDDRFAETDGYGAAAIDPGFAAQFIGKAVPVKLEDIDAISGATMTSKAVIAAINSAVESGNIVGENVEEEPAAVEPTPEPEKEESAVPEDALVNAKQGFAGPVAVTLTFDEKGAISFLKIGDDKFAETKGFGEAALEPAFAEQFIGKLPPLSAKKADEDASENTVDGISGATLTTNAVLDAINEVYVQQFPVEEEPEAVEPTAEPEKEESAVPEDALVNAKQGFAGPVAVTLTFDEKGAISFLKIGDDKFAETKGFGEAALEPAFAEQFIGKVPPLSAKKADEDAGENTVDGITGATLTTNAVLDAINEVYVQQFPVEEEPAAVEPTAEPEKEESAVPEDALVNAKQGFAGPVAVTLTFDEKGAISFLKIGDDKFAETKGFGEAALEPAFAEQFIGKLPPLSAKKADEDASENTVDGITGATLTTNAVLDAINELYTQQFKEASQQ
ncbi:MAG: FMN-binding protein [Bacillota bacterium]|nr:FMN-binding protein [Bacillota bacterium]